MNEGWSDFEHQVWKDLKSFELHEKKSYLLTVSGGLDSMALLEVMLRLRPSAELKILHFHHGDGSSHRDEVAAFLQHKISALQKKNISLVVEKSIALLKSENQMRQARWQFIRQHRNKLEPILTAHHLDDHFETLFLKMLRGTSLEGISAFQKWNEEIFRPFLGFSKKELLDYAQSRNLSWLEDPTNQSESYLRNWLRQNWLPLLEEKQPGAVKNFSLSLLKIVEDAKSQSSFLLSYYKNQPELGLDRAWFLSLTYQNQLRCLSIYLKKRQQFEFTRGQLEEILKRLDKNQKDITFKLFERKWVINAMQIMLE